MSGETHLHEPSAILGYYDQLHPAVGELLRMPALVVHSFEAALFTHRLVCLTTRLDGGQDQGNRGHKK